MDIVISALLAIVLGVLANLLTDPVKKRLTNQTLNQTARQIEELEVHLLQLAYLNTDPTERIAVLVRRVLRALLYSISAVLLGLLVVVTQLFVIALPNQSKESSLVFFLNAIAVLAIAGSAFLMVSVYRLVFDAIATDHELQDFNKSASLLERKINQLKQLSTKK